MVSICNPKVIFLISGKRKSGKDYLAEKLHSRLSDKNPVIICLAAPIKHHFALTHNLDYNEMLSSSSYKEKYRKEMVLWSDDIRDNDASFFIRQAIEMFKANEYEIWIISDVRRKSDIKWFRQNFTTITILTIRITTSEEVRISRGFIFNPDIDKASTECDLDFETDWDFNFENNLCGDSEINSFIENVIQEVYKS